MINFCCNVVHVSNCTHVLIISLPENPSLVYSLNLSFYTDPHELIKLQLINNNHFSSYGLLPISYSTGTISTHACSYPASIPLAKLIYNADFDVVGRKNCNCPFTILEDELSDGSTDVPPVVFTTACVDELLGSDKEDKMEVDDGGEAVLNNSKPASDSASVADSDSFHSTKSSGPASQRTVSAAYKSVRAAKLAALTCRSLATGSSTPLTPTGSLMDTRDGRNFMSFQVSSFSANRNLTASFDTASLTCKTCELKPDHTVLFSSKNLDPKIQPEPVVFILADQSFPACVPAGGTGHCLKIIRLEDGSLADLSNVFLETIHKHILPAGSVVLLHSLSHLKWVGTAAYAEDFVRSRQRILATYRSGTAWSSYTG